MGQAQNSPYLFFPLTILISDMGQAQHPAFLFLDYGLFG
jgi:hypothetical protein